MKTPLKRRALLSATTVLAALALLAPAQSAHAAPVPDLVCRLDAEVNFTPPLSVLVRQAAVDGHIGYHDCRSPNGAAPHLTGIVFHVTGVGRFGAVPVPTFSVEGTGTGTWNTGETGGLYFNGELKKGSPVPDREVTSGPLAGDGINGLQIPLPRFDKIDPNGVAGFDVTGQVCFWNGEKGRCTAY
ncbi:hypothetical protein SSP24_59490 [Streptomyces spinoverrucosus]|uniref:Uncharacterized protein n=2 Tax=Streptomyces spinoverrucosus TaxID=284043 RepID=A0A4Y3VMZ3_9ACTN|nr:hypothetical protein SSP24_59490 [Streptomyces spinoverrucosus]GHB88348.1 hypothetical protein GCM10010397_70460 [Streptomyces spinoverrucosus]